MPTRKPTTPLFSWSCLIAGLALLVGAGSALTNRFYLFNFRPLLRGSLLVSGVLALLGGASLLALAFRAFRSPEIFRALAESISKVAALVTTLLVWIAILAFLPIPAVHRRIDGLTTLGILALVAGLPLVLAPRRFAPLAAKALGSKTAQAVRLVAWCTLSALVGTELLVRVFDPLLTPPTGLVSGDQSVRARLRAGHPVRGSLSRANSLGYNDTEWATSKAPGLFRIAALGDSFCYGEVGYDANVLTLLEADLQGPGRSVEVLNFGIWSTEPADYLDTLRADALRFEPDLVLICFFVGNDFSFSAKERLIVGGHIVRADPTSNPFQKLVDKNRWYLYQHVRLRAVARRSVQNRTEHRSNKAATFTEQAYARIQARRLLTFSYTGKEGLDRGMANAAKSLDAIVQQSRKAGAGVVLAVFPDEFQVDTAERQRSMNASHTVAGDLDLDRPQRLLADWGRSRGVPVIDLLPAFQSAGARQRVYLLRNTHWNETGNRLAAEVLTRELARYLPGAETAVSRQQPAVPQ